MKKIFIISLALLAITIFLLGVYNFAFRKNTNNSAQAPAVQNTSTQNSTTKTTNTGDVPVPIKKSKVVAVSKEPVLGVVVDKKNETISFYSAVDGTVWQVNLDGTGLLQTVPVKLPGIRHVEWSPDATKVLTEFDKNGNSVFYSYDYKTKVGTQLKDGIDAVIWDGIGSKVIYKYFDPKTKQRSLNIANADGTDWKKLADIPFRKISLAMAPLSSVVSFWNFSDAAQETQLQTVSTNGGASSTLLKGHFGADYSWSPNGSQALVSSLSNSGSSTITLGTVSAAGVYNDLDIPTFVSKCAWSADNKTVYYAMPGGIPDGSVLPNDYIEKKFMTEDTFWKLDITTGKKDRIIDPGELGGKYDSTSLILSPTEDALFFINRADGRLYRMQL
jgi:hypothetical protein